MATHYFNTVENNVTGKPVAGASVRVLNGAGVSTVTIYSDDGVTSIADSTVTTDSYGFFEFWTNETSVSIEISYDGDVKRTITDVDLIGGTTSGDVTDLQTRMSAAETVTQDALIVDIAGLSDPGADRLMFWDDSAGEITWLTLDDSLSITGTTIAAVGDDTAYDATSWNGSLDAPTKNAIRDKIESMGGSQTESFVIAASDETTSLTAGTGKITFRMPYAFTLSAVRASVTTAPTGSTLIVDINEGGVSILSTKLSIDASEKTSTTAASAAVISDTALADDAEITIDIDQVGSTVPGAGLKVVLIGTKA